MGEEEIGGLVVVVERVLGQSFDCKCAPWEERVETMPGFLRNRPRAKIRSVVDMRGEEHGPHPLPILRL
ncbi:MAG: hypothetical protein M0002_07955 [Rhodospirillales bacterium]|nr:hypothetical protein [Rhodospirillales bacterium]